LGKWLYGEGEKLYGSRPEYIALKEKHRIFHAEAAKIAVLINDKRYKEAEAAMGSNLPYGNASLSVVSAISAIKKIL
jgi:methyl-accepting chemotaxis protein